MRFNKLYENILELSTAVLIVSILIINIAVIFSSYKAYEDSINRINAIVYSVLNHPKKYGFAQDGDKKIEYSKFVLEFKEGGFFSANTIAFFFQLFTVATITMGGYVLSKAKQEVSSAKAELQNVKEHSRQNVYFAQILTSTVLIEWIIENEIMNSPEIESAFNEIFPLVREKMKLLIETTEKIINNKIILSQENHTLLDSVLKKINRVQRFMDHNDRTELAKLTELVGKIMIPHK